VFFDEEGDVFDLELLIENPLRLDQEDGPPLTESVASRRDDQDLVLKVLLPNLLFEGLFDLEGSAGNTSGAGANQ
jgi:hypothetical protein